MGAGYTASLSNTDVAELLMEGLSPEDRHAMLVSERIVRDSTYSSSHRAGCHNIKDALSERRMSAIEESLDGLRRGTCCQTRGSKLALDAAARLPGILDAMNTINSGRRVAQSLKEGGVLLTENVLNTVLALDHVVESGRSDAPYTQRAAELAKVEKQRVQRLARTLYAGRNGAIHAQSGHGWRESDFGLAMHAACSGGPSGMAVIVGVKRDKHLPALRAWAVGEEIFRHNGLILVRTGKQLAHLAAQSMRSTTPLLAEWEPNRPRWSSEAMLALDLISNSATPLLDLTRREAEALVAKAFAVAPAACA